MIKTKACLVNAVEPLLVDLNGESLEMHNPVQVDDQPAHDTEVIQGIVMDNVNTPGKKQKV